MRFAVSAATSPRAFFAIRSIECTRQAKRKKTQRWLTSFLFASWRGKYQRSCKVRSNMPERLQNVGLTDSGAVHAAPSRRPAPSRGEIKVALQAGNGCQE